MKKHSKLAVGICAYAIAYGIVRSTHLLVHGVSYAGLGTEDVQYFHKVVQGDVGFNIAAMAISEASFWLFIPLRLGEKLTWNLLPYDDSELQMWDSKTRAPQASNLRAFCLRG